MAETTIVITTTYGGTAPATPPAPAGFTFVTQQVDEDVDANTATYTFIYSDPHVSTLDGENYTL